jgi:hypothetical protein
MNYSRRRGHVESFVVIMIIGVIAGLLLPVIQHFRSNPAGREYADGFLWTLIGLLYFAFVAMVGEEVSIRVRLARFQWGSKKRFGLSHGFRSRLCLGLVLPVVAVLLWMIGISPFQDVTQYPWYLFFASFHWYALWLLNVSTTIITAIVIFRAKRRVDLVLPRYVAERWDIVFNTASIIQHRIWERHHAIRMVKSSIRSLLKRGYEVVRKK